jgi:hypothetical protein
LYTIKKIRAIFQFDALLFAEFRKKNITSVQILAPGASVTTVAGLGYSFGT